MFEIESSDDGNDTRERVDENESVTNTESIEEYQESEEPLAQSFFEDSNEPNTVCSDSETQVLYETNLLGNSSTIDLEVKVAIF